MSDDDAVYVLRESPRSDDEPDIGSEGFVFADEESLLGRPDICWDFMSLDTSHRDWTTPRLSGVWKPRSVEGNARSGLDYCTVDCSVPAFSQRAVEGLKDMLEPNGELLPLITPAGIGPYWAYNLRTVADVLDESHSVLDRYEGKEFLASSVKHYEFVLNRSSGLSIFWIPNVTVPMHVTERFAQRVRELGLTGFHFAKVWPLPPGTDWERLAKMDYGKTQGLPAAQRPVPTPERSAAKIHSRKLSRTEEKSLREAIAEYQQDSGFVAKNVSVEQIQKQIDKAVKETQASASRGTKYLLDRAFLLGVAWGETLVRDMGWRWEMLVADTKEETLAVVSPDRGLAVPALLFLKRLVTHADADPTTILTFNMIKAGEFRGEPGALKLIS